MARMRTIRLWEVMEDGVPALHVLEHGCQRELARAKAGAVWDVASVHALDEAKAVLALARAPQPDVKADPRRWAEIEAAKARVTAVRAEGV